MTIQDLDNLQIALNESIDALKSHYRQRSLDIPSLNEAYHPDAAEALAFEPEVSRILSIITAASYQIVATVRPPYFSALDAAFAYTLPACLRVVEQINVAEILREAGPDGLHVSIIAAGAGMEPTKLSRVLRILATHHIFREVKPNIFATNRISSSFATEKSPEWLADHPHEKYDAISGEAAAQIGLLTDYGYKAGAYLCETMLAPETRYSFKADQTPFNTALNMEQSLWDWMEEGPRLRRCSAAIRATSHWNPPDAILQGYDWGSLSPSDLVVDVGGGNGTPAMAIARAHPSVRIVIQDREATIQQGKVLWSANYPEALSSGRVSFQMHEFFDEQPQENVSVFNLRIVLHDWPDEECVMILTRLRDAASATTKLVIGDYNIPYACADDRNFNIPGERAPSPPQPLLANFGKANVLPYGVDMLMHLLCNGQECTTAHLVDLARRAGWRVSKLNRVEVSCFGYLVAKPI